MAGNGDMGGDEGEVWGWGMGERCGGGGGVGGGVGGVCTELPAGTMPFLSHRPHILRARATQTL